MKKNLFLLLTLAVMPLLCKGAIYNDDPKNVPIEKTEDVKENNPRSFLQTPITCLYSCGTFTFSFHEVFLNVTIKVENTTTGEQWTQFSDSYETIIKIQTSSSSGLYNISIYVDDELYTGIFKKTN